MGMGMGEDGAGGRGRRCAALRREGDSRPRCPLFVCVCGGIKRTSAGSNRELGFLEREESEY